MNIIDELYEDIKKLNCFNTSCLGLNKLNKFWSLCELRRDKRGAQNYHTIFFKNFLNKFITFYFFYFYFLFYYN